MTVAVTTPVPLAASNGLIDVCLAAIRPAADDTNLFDFSRSDQAPLPPAEPGAHIDLHLPNGMTRQYSLVTPHQNPDCYTLGIKRDPNSRGGSRYIFDELKVGQAVRISAPRNHFPLAAAAPHHVLIAGGIGITPIFAMIQRLRADGAPFNLHYAGRSRSQLAFLDDLDGAPFAHIHCDDEHDGALLDLMSVVAHAPAGSHFYCCGPAPMLEVFRAATVALSPERVHFEYFTPKEEASTAGGFVVELARSGREVLIPLGQTILEALREAGLELDSSCQEGICGVCETKVIAGIPDHRDAVLSDGEHAANKTMMICCSGSKSERLVLDL
ncbi:PDR/VanB family oxidoreductase [Rhodoplanes sp. Z2-YC6860]|uniref:PDR/VanB family oxidoreductase n=1 Tax=Rhodoplanes sp. Z2-YC6860 TaxID=674703 RepID=UPI00078DEAC8|nr:PDR/VanB family oxidoreductase [Rhodoplanes sp. Z2-YC6860]AMN42863.1 4-aminobenzenesulfonate 3,4-dioxygenase reductase [Rhodoplanes sp. Z2-YC6860]